MHRSTPIQRPRPSGGVLGAAVAVWVLLPAGGGCRETSPPTARGPSPREVVERIIELREGGRYAAMEKFIVPNQADGVLSTLAAVDEFLSANRALTTYVRDNLELGLSQAIDYGRFVNHLGIFSRDVELISEVIEGNAAQVAYSVAGKLPLSRAALVRTDGGWLYDPGDGFDPRLPAAFRAMAGGLRQVREDLASGRLDNAQMRADPEKLIEEVRLRLADGVAQLPPPPDE